VKQETLAEELGISQQSVSHIEKSETLENKKLEEVAKVLGVTSETIKNFSEENGINYFNDNSASQGNSFNQGMYATFNPLDKLVEAYEENKKLYERLVQAERDKLSYLEGLIKKNWISLKFKSLLDRF